MGLLASIMIDPSDPQWRDLLELDARMQQQKKIRLLTPEARVLFTLSIGGPMQINSAIQVAGTSYRGFYAVLERLKQAGLVQINKDSDDHRVRKLSVEQIDVSLDSE